MGCSLRLATWSLGLSLLGCAATPRSGDAALATQAAEVTFQVRAQARGTDEWQPLSTEDVVHSGDRLTIAVQATAPMYLYIGEALTDRPIKLLAPADSTEPAPLRPGQTYSLPTDNKGLELDTQVGEESLYFVASQSMLPIDRAKELMAAAPLAELGQGRPRPPTSTNSNRGAQQSQRVAAPAYLVKPLSPGLFAVRFTFQHQQ